MKSKFLRGAVVTILILLVAGPAFGQRGARGGGAGLGGGSRGGGIGAIRGGGGIGAIRGGMSLGRSGGGLGSLGGGRIGGGSSLRSGGFSGLSGGGIRSSAGLSPRSSSGLGSLSGMRSGGTSFGSAIPRSSGNSIGSSMSRSPGINLGSALSRSPGVNPSRQGNTTLRPQTNSLPGINLQDRIQSALGQGNRNPLGGQALGGQSSAASRLGNMLDSARSRAGTSGQGNLDRNPGNIVSRATGGGALGQNATAGRISANDVGRFLNLPGRQPGGDTSGLTRAGQPAIRSNANLTNLTRGDSVGGLRDSAAGLRGSALNLNAGQASRIRGSMQTAFNRSLAGVNVNDRVALNNAVLSPNRALHWNNWAGNVRGTWNPYRFHSCFNNRFWAFHHCYFPWRRSYYWWGARPWGYWWGRPTWNSCVSWFPSWGWSTPYYYDYGPGGNVVYSSGYVYVNGDPIATADDYAASAYDLAAVPEPANPDEATEWLPLGTFAIAAGEEDKDPSRVLQLAVDKEGTISGTMHNETTKQTYAVQGRVDKETQRVAFTIGENKDVVFETGIYNLTQQQTPLLAHGEGRTETYLLLRLDPPKTDDAAAPPAGNSRTLVP